MKNLLVIKQLLCACSIFSSVYSQNLKRVKLSDKEKQEGVIMKYSYLNRYDGGITLVLHSDKNFYYTIEATNYHAFSSGQWNAKNTDIYLSSDIIDSAVPVLVQYLSNAPDSGKSNTLFLIPINLKGDKFTDSRIYVNNDSTYCFPFFDTCIGSYALVDKIKIDFGSGYKSKWIKVNFKNREKVLIVAQTEFILSSYLSFKKRRYKVVGSELKLYNSNTK